MWQEIGHIQLRKIYDQELGSMQYWGYHENILIILVLPSKHFKNIWFSLSIKFM